MLTIADNQRDDYDYRVCLYCPSGVTGSEIYLILECPATSDVAMDLIKLLTTRATSLDMAEAFRPLHHLRAEAFTKPTLIIISKTPELKKLGTWKLVADALKKTPLGPVRDRFVLPVLP